MGKVAILKVGSGSFEQGFEVLLQIKTDDNRLLTELEGKLPPNPGLEGHYISWQTRFRQLTGSGEFRRRFQEGNTESWEIEAAFPQDQSLGNDLSRCRQLVRRVEHQMKDWLQSSTPSWRRIREQMRVEFADSTEEVRFILQAREPRLWKLPWHVWDLLEEYGIGIGYTLPEFKASQASVQYSTRSRKARILAVFGDKQNLNLKPDQDAIHKLKGAESVFMHQPSAKQFIRTLRNPRGWDIFFFAGHSQTEAHRGRIYLSNRESLTPDEFKNALKEAAQHGLKIAIFNSCDGLGLAKELIKGRIPVAIVMQEVVPDEVAQTFLKEFLTEYGTGETLYTSVYLAQSRLEDFQALPGAPWLPLIFQNQADIPPTWQQLQQFNRTPVKRLMNRKGSRILQSSGTTLLNLTSHRRSTQRILIALCASLITAFSLNFVRDIGYLEWLEFRAFDSLMRSRPVQAMDQRLVIIDITQNDVNNQNIPEDEGKNKPIYDNQLEKLLEKLAAYEPSVIGLDIYRDYRIKPEYQSLVERLQQDDRLITVCEIGDSGENSGRGPSPHVAAAQNWQQRIGFTNVVLDRDGHVRRQLLTLIPPIDQKFSPCRSQLPFSYLVALKYLQQKGLATSSPNPQEQNFPLSKFESHILQADNGNYAQIIEPGQQILLNYHPAGQNLAERISLAEFLYDPIDLARVKDKIVLIGTSDPSFQTDYVTAYGEMSGVILQAHAVSQLVSAVADQRPLLGWWQQWQEELWILGWALLGGLLAISMRPRFVLILALPMLWILYRYCYWLLVGQGLWVPFVPSAIAFISALLITLTLCRKPKS
ncbi:MAG: CHASE2 domain-containing protein [Oscillatoriales cyanobacterium RM2_1_1]|nr:CHASE2 domain-containing protein [Oscillatoriales cyanobacterium SM2_3_0]NJO46540.1 CHASE2 domain-containing protein [Oscillatoriales cyanobacterium RM2_1_1]